MKEILGCIECDKTQEYFEKQIKGLILIMEDCKAEPFIARSYVVEKLNMILFKGINFHPSIRGALVGKTAMDLVEELRDSEE